MQYDLTLNRNFWLGKGHRRLILFLGFRYIPLWLLGYLVVQKMFEDGILKQNDKGEYEAVLDPAESEYIRSEISKTKRKNAMSALDAEEIQKQLEKLEGEAEESGME